MQVPGGFICKSQNVKIIQIPISWWADEQTAVYPHEYYTGTNPRELQNAFAPREQRDRADCACVTPRTWEVPRRQVHSAGEQVLGREGRDAGATGDRHALPLRCVAGAHLAEWTEITELGVDPWNCWKWVDFTVCKLHLHKTVF